MLQLNAINGPYVVCDECKSVYHLSGNCIPRYGTKFLVPQLRKYGMQILGPHICKTCKKSPTEVLSQQLA